MFSQKTDSNPYLGEVTKKLATVFQWDNNIVQTMKLEIKAKNEKFHDRGLIKEFFKFPEHIRPSDYQRSNDRMAIRNGRYFQLMVVHTSNVELAERIWSGQVTKEENELAKRLFNHSDSDLAIIVSELADLHLTMVGTAEVARYDEKHFSNPVSHFSDLECFKRAEQNIEDDPELRGKLEKMEQMLQSSNKWTEKQLSDQFRLPNVALFRADSGACVGYDWKVQKFCEEPVKEGSNKCLKHLQEGNDLKMIREIGTLVTQRGISIAKDVIRVHIGPAPLDKTVEYAPSLEGAAPAYRHSTDNLEKLLEACDVTFKQGYPDKISYFDPKPFQIRFPNAKTISKERWKHSYLAMLESMQAYAFDLKANWTRNLPFLLGKLGIYQGWLDAQEIIDQKKFITSRYEYKPLGTIADLLKDTSTRARPVAPALIYEPKLMDGTATPSNQTTDRDGKCCKLDTEGLSFSEVS